VRIAEDELQRVRRLSADLLLKASADLLVARPAKP
jgi:hypothetical protein